MDVASCENAALVIVSGADGCIGTLFFVGDALIGVPAVYCSVAPQGAGEFSAYAELCVIFVNAAGFADIISFVRPPGRRPRRV